MSKPLDKCGKKPAIPKLLILQSHPIQYYAPLYRALAKRGRLRVKVVYLSDAGSTAHYDPGFGQEVAWDIPLLEGYDYHLLQPSSRITNRSFWQMHDANLLRVLRDEKPDWILVYGYAYLMNWVAVLWAKRAGIRTAYTSDSNVRLMQRDWRLLVKQTVVGWLFRRIDMFLSPSDANRDYLLALGAQADKIHWSPFAVEFARFNSAGASANTASVDFIWASKFIEFKRPLDFVRALSELSRRGHQGLSARIIGTGPLHDEVHRSIQRLMPAGNVSLTGFVNQTAMPFELSRGRIFVFTSERDPYGLAATEAAACGLALIVADVNGCVDSKASARPGINALTYRAGDIEALVEHMETLLRDPGRVKAMQRASTAIASEHDIGRAAEIIESMVIQDGRVHA